MPLGKGELWYIRLFDENKPAKSRLGWYSEQKIHGPYGLSVDGWMKVAIPVVVGFFCSPVRSSF